MAVSERLRMAQFSARVGVSADVLRAWERRYGLLTPARSEGGFRLYSEADEWRVRLMQEKLRTGLSAAEAARGVKALAGSPGSRSAEPGEPPAPEQLSQELSAALERFDEETAEAVLDKTLGVLGLEGTIREVLVPYLHRVGERWKAGDLNVGQEHFASRLLEGRLLALARGWNKGPGPRAVLACPTGEQHTLPLVCFGLVLRNRGWRNIYLGGDTPAAAIRMAADTVEADLIVLSAVTSGRFEPLVKQLRTLGRLRRLLIAGAGATPELAARAEVEYLSGDPVTAAEGLSIEHAWAVAARA